MAEQRLTAKQELILTLEEMARIVGVNQLGAPHLRLVQMRGLVDHARAVVQRVGNEARPPRKAVRDRVLANALRGMPPAGGAA